jgi:RecB family endonuclease NucS
MTIKALVIESYRAHGGMPPYETITALIRESFPLSKWQETHYAWYKSKIKTGEISISEDGRSENETDEIDVDEEIIESIDAQISLERDLQKNLAHKVGQIEPGLRLIEGGIEFVTEAGRIDLLAKDAVGDLVVIELKAGKAKDAALGQLLGYIGCLMRGGQKVRGGILIASSFDQRVIFAARASPNIKLMKYEVEFKLIKIES